MSDRCPKHPPCSSLSAEDLARRQENPGGSSIGTLRVALCLLSGGCKLGNRFPPPHADQIGPFGEADPAGDPDPGPDCYGANDRREALHTAILYLMSSCERNREVPMWVVCEVEALEALSRGSRHGT